MAPVYSHSRLSTFEECRYRFKLRYVDKVKVEEAATIEQHLGTCAHAALEWLYSLVLRGRVATQAELLAKYDELWEADWDDSIRVVKTELEPGHYREMGRRGLADYYARHAPFEGARTLGLELRVTVELPGGHRLQGFIDRLDKTPEDRFEIHDYKTGGRLPDRAWANTDRQLALYALAVKDRFEEAQADNIDLIWHYLAFDMELRSQRSEAELNQLAEQTASLIESVEAAVAARDLPPAPGTLCDWCEYRALCPEFKHLYQLETKAGGGPALEGAKGQTALSAADLTAQEAAALVEQLAELRAAKQETAASEARLKERLIQYSRQTGVTMVYGDTHKASVAPFESVSLPPSGGAERVALEARLRELGCWESVADLSVSRLKSLLAKGTDLGRALTPGQREALRELVRVQQRWRVSLRKR